MSGADETVVVDVDSVTDLPLEALYAELHELRARLAGEAEAAERDGPEAERRGSAFWFASWKNGNRQRVELMREVERLKRLIARMTTATEQAADLHVVAITERDAQIARLQTDLDRAERSSDALMTIARAAVRAIAEGRGDGDLEVEALALAVGL